MQFPQFKYREAYRENITSMDQIENVFFDAPISPHRCYRGMSNYSFICISTFYRYFLGLREHKWEETRFFHNDIESFPVFDKDEYKKLSYEILDDFYQNLLKLGSKELSLNSIAYLAQHYGLPTNLIDFTCDPKVALYFACKDDPKDDCSIYMTDIYAHVKTFMDIYGSGRIGYEKDQDGNILTREQQAEKARVRSTTISRDGMDLVSPIIELDDIKFSQRIKNQSGMFVYDRSTLPFDTKMHWLQWSTHYNQNKVFNISQTLKADILNVLDSRYGIDETFIYPRIEGDPNLKVILDAVEMTKIKFSL